MMKWKIVALNFSEYFKCTREKFYFELSEEQNLRKVVESLLTTYEKKYICCCLQKKLIEKIPGPCNAEESFLRKKNRKSLKQSEIITYQPKTFKNPNIVDIESFMIETLHRLSKTTREVKKTGSNSSLYSDIKQGKNFLNEKNVKITKPEHAFKD